ncbi:hypothetical protein GCM10009677_04050 [Sphaerisporangium rubeum]|uniref:Uncharacterized protein n=1 Tax=Sphaerisporangium rubeum TaxID=321317 RepID=A0A7X0I8U2_9ACTN|nr:hypothetical protein [Sphaerisporangium rubeum]MBB6470752.1 hypothetical protein [Sphaerisporangium rubeum]
MDSRNGPRRVAGAGRVALVVSALVLSAGVVSPGGVADAAASPGRPRAHRHDGHHSNRLRIGNGKGNKVFVEWNSPAYLNGAQHGENSAIGGAVFSASAICRSRHRVCKIRQRLR